MSFIKYQSTPGKFPKTSAGNSENPHQTFQNTKKGPTLSETRKNFLKKLTKKIPETSHHGQPPSNKITHKNKNMRKKKQRPPNKPKAPPSKTRPIRPLAQISPKRSTGASQPATPKLKPMDYKTQLCSGLGEAIGSFFR